MPTHPKIDRRKFLATSTAATGLAAGSHFARQSLAASSPNQNSAWQPNWLVASCMYGYAKLEEILPELAKVGSKAIDLWPKVHGSQREELDEMGEEELAALLEQHKIQLGCLTQYKLGPFHLREEIQIAKRLNCPIIVTSAKGKRGKGEAQKASISDFAEKMKPEFEAAAEAGVKILIENHGSSVIDSLDGIRWLLEYCDGPGFGFALAPAHLPQEPELLAELPDPR